MELPGNRPKIVASTGSIYSHSIADSLCREKALRLDLARDAHPSYEDEHPRTSYSGVEDDTESNYFKSMQWTPDGTCLLTNSADNIIRTFIAPSDLLVPRTSPHTLTPYSSLQFPEPVYALAPYPFFSLSDPSTTLLLSSVRDHPIRLFNALSPSPSIISSYLLVSPTTEAYLTPSALCFLPSGTHFYTGTDCLISLFDLSISGSGPTTRLPTIPSKRHKMKGGGVGMRGIVSCLSLQPPDTTGASSMLAAGTFTRWVGLYDAEGAGGTVANWSVASAADGEAGIGGAGVTQVVWSPCGRYLSVVERKSQGILVYDVRVTGKLVCWLEGREADTNQRLSVDVFPSSETQGCEIWGGGTDGKVCVWDDVGFRQGRQPPTWKWQAHEEGVSVTSVAIHGSGSVIATSSGQRNALGVSDAKVEAPDDSSGLSESENESESESESEDDSEDGDGGSSSGTSITSSIGSERGHAVCDNTVKIWSL